MPKLDIDEMLNAELGTKYNKVEVPKGTNPFEKAKQTNAYRIRSMTDEELAEFLKGIDNGHEIVMGDYFYTKKYAVMMSSDKVLEWLQKECEV